MTPENIISVTPEYLHDDFHDPRKKKIIVILQGRRKNNIDNIIHKPLFRANINIKLASTFHQVKLSV